MPAVGDDMHIVGADRYAVMTCLKTVRVGDGLAVRTAEAIGPVSVDMGDTACKVPYAPDYIQKIRQRGTIGKKRKTAKC